MKFMCTHTLPPNSLTREQIEQVSRAAQNDPNVRGYRSFFNLSEGKVICILEASDRQKVIEWFDRMGLPYDNVCSIELEGERARISDQRLQQPVAQGQPMASA